MTGVCLPPSMQVIERGWLSSNNILFFDGPHASIIDTGYAGQAQQTLSLVNSALVERGKHQARPAPGLVHIINTHSHSDHVGGNAALQAAYAQCGCRITIPAGIAGLIDNWDEEALLLSSAGQRGERFTHDSVMHAGEEIELGNLRWQALAAPGHDMHALMFFCPEQGLLISGDALWQDGFGVVFGELLGDAQALPATRRTLESIAKLDVAAVIPGHGAPFADVEAALARALRRLDGYEANKTRLARNAIKALLTFNLLDRQRLRLEELPAYLAGIPFFTGICAQLELPDGTDVVAWLVEELLRARAAAIEDGWLLPRMAA